MTSSTATGQDGTVADTQRVADKVPITLKVCACNYPIWGRKGVTARRGVHLNPNNSNDLFYPGYIGRAKCQQGSDAANWVNEYVSGDF
ncbi:hypothetical protein SFRURICE_008250 [Spodoptera frugiperda]|uniref:SFRICE_005739 n=1 Tax=Spodoptera frugiperda TaxID=7108 RepID=A0A2H1VR36_SPOFR|nr:hypothetical protein SFRURICE_008250 [Spodoptera frugiperda]